MPRGNILQLRATHIELVGDLAHGPDDSDDGGPHAELGGAGRLAGVVSLAVVAVCGTVGLDRSVLDRHVGMCFRVGVERQETASSQVLSHNKTIDRPSHGPGAETRCHLSQPEEKYRSISDFAPVSTNRFCRANAWQSPRTIVDVGQRRMVMVPPAIGQRCVAQAPTALPATTTLLRIVRCAADDGHLRLSSPLEMSVVP